MLGLGKFFERTRHADREEAMAAVDQINESCNDAMKFLGAEMMETFDGMDESDIAVIKTCMKAYNASMKLLDQQTRALFETLEEVTTLKEQIRTMQRDIDNMEKTLRGIDNNVLQIKADTGTIRNK